MRPVREPNSKDLKPGQRLWSVWFDDKDDPTRPVICYANFVKRNHGWITLRNVQTGEEWKQNGTMWWFLSRKDALLHQIWIESGCMGFPGYDPDVQMEKLIRLVRRLDRVEKKT